MSSESYFERVKARVMKKAQEEYEAEKLYRSIQERLGLLQGKKQGPNLKLCASCRKQLEPWIEAMVQDCERLARYFEER